MIVLQPTLFFFLRSVCLGSSSSGASPPQGIVSHEAYLVFIIIAQRASVLKESMSTLPTQGR